MTTGDPLDKLDHDDIADLAERAAIQAEAKQRVTHDFEILSEDRYRLIIPEIAASIEIARLRRERGELIGELAVKCGLPGIKSYGGTVSIADFNLSSARARTERGKLLTERAGREMDIDWHGHLEELCQRILAAERKGNPAVDLRTIPRPAPDDGIRIDDISLPRRHPSVIFGDGGSAKSYLALYLLGRLAMQGMRVALFDWELAGEDHRDRLERLFPVMPLITYARCTRSLHIEADRLARIVRDERIEYAIFDSVVFACDGPPEAAESVLRYFQALARIRVGSAHIAHTTKSEGGDQKPFGSVFWHNGARATWYVKLADTSADGKEIAIGLFNRKANLTRLCRPAGYKIIFDDWSTTFATTDPADISDLAIKMTVSQRLEYALRHGAKSIDDVALEIETEAETIRRTVRRTRDRFVLLQGGKVGLSRRMRDI